MPDYELEKLLVSIFGKRGHPTIKFYRMMYWIPKFKHLNPWLLPNPVPEEAFELAKLGVRQMCSVDVESEISVLDTADVEDSLDKTWIVSGQSPEQRKLLREHPADSSLHIQGPFVIWLRNQTITYFTLVGDAVPDEMFEEDIDEDGKLQASWMCIVDSLFIHCLCFRCQRFEDSVISEHIWIKRKF